MVNASPMGMAAHPGSPVPDELLQARPLGRRHRLPAPRDHAPGTPRASAGCTVLDGAGMAVHQAADAFELITGRVADRSSMLRDFDQLVAAEATATTSYSTDPARDTSGERNR